MVSFWLTQWWYIICGFHVSSFPRSYVSCLISYVFCDVLFKFNMFGIWKTSFLNTEIAWSLLIIADVDHKRLLRIHNTPHMVVFLHLHYLNFKNKPMEVFSFQNIFPFQATECEQDYVNCWDWRLILFHLSDWFRANSVGFYFLKMSCRICDHTW